MKLRRVLTKNGPQVEALKSDTTNVWVPLSAIETLSSISKRFLIDNLATNILSVLALGYDGWKILSEQVDKCPITNMESKPVVILPFQPLLFRDFALFEQHWIDASRGSAKRFFPKKYRMATWYETITGKTFSKFKPPALWYERPLYFLGNHLNFVTSGEDVHRPVYTQALDYELAFGFILAKPLLNATLDEAQRAIGGYVVLNDFSARDVQIAELKTGFGPQKSKHFLTGMAPIVVTADEINDRVNRLHGSVSIDEKVCAHCNTVNIQFPLNEIIASVSRGEQLHAGELFGSGSLPGGCGMENDHWIQPGQVINVKIDGISELNNWIVYEKTEQ